jgi:hypothetical protein
MPRDPRPFITLHDGMPDHPKIEALSDAAFRLLVSTWCWCNRNRTDGKVASTSWNKRGTSRARKELIESGLALPIDDGVQMHDYLEHQRSAAEIDELSEKRREAGRKGGKAKATSQASAKASAKQVLDEVALESGSRFDNAGRHADAAPVTDRPVKGDDSEPLSVSESGKSQLATAKANAKQKPKQTGSKSVAEKEEEQKTYLRTSKGSPNVPAGSVARIVKLYVEASTNAGVPAPEESQDRVSRSARSLLNQGFAIDQIEDAARNAAVGGWTDLATQIQRDASRSSPATNGRTSTTDQRFQDALTLADHLERKEITG